MRLTERQLATGVEAAARFIEPLYDQLDHYQKHGLRKQMRDWLSPCLLLLPDTVTPDQLNQDVYRIEFLEASGAFLVNSMRRNQLFDQYTDGQLKQRISTAELEESAENLSYLCAVALEAIYGLVPLPPGETFTSVLERDLSQASVAPEGEDWDEALRDLL